MAHVERLTESTLGSLYGCCELFPLCTDEDIVAMSFNRSEPFLDWIGWELTDLCDIERGYLNWVRPAAYQGGRSAGYLADPCADPNGVDYGVCTFRLHDFGRLRRAGPVRDVTMSRVRLCENYPRFRIGGQQITDEREWSLMMAVESMLQDYKRMVITGNAATPGQFSGLNTLISSAYTDPTGRRCASMDSNVIEWAGNDLNGNGGAAMNWNGHVIPAATNIIDVLLEAYRNVRQRLMWSSLPGQLRVGDMVLVAPTFLVRCILDQFTCWSVCPGTAYDPTVILNYEGRTFRNDLLGGLFGAGRIYLDGFEIPLIAYDWDTIHGTQRGDMYLLTGRQGNVPLIQGQLDDMRQVAAGDKFGNFVVTDGGRVLTWQVQDHTCVEEIAEMRPRMLMWAPWAQTRFQNVECVSYHGPISPDPWATSFAYETSFTSAACENAEEEAV